MLRTSTSTTRGWAATGVATRLRVFAPRTRRALAAYLFGSVALGIAIFAILGVTLPDPVRWVFLGAYPVAVAWSVGGILTRNGTTHLLMGAAAEGPTRAFLRRLEKRGWTAIAGVPHKGGDVDLVLLGRQGVFAIDTRYAPDLEGLDPESVEPEWLDRARGGAADMKWRLTHLGVKWVHPVLLIWGPGVDTVNGSHFTANQVFVAAGSRNREWLDEMLALATDHDLPVHAMRQALVESREAG